MILRMKIKPEDQTIFYFYLAWLIRFNEVVKKEGVLMITTAGQWDSNALLSIIGSK